MAPPLIDPSLIAAVSDYQARSIRMSQEVMRAVEGFQEHQRRAFEALEPAMRTAQEQMAFARLALAANHAALAQLGGIASGFGSFAETLRAMNALPPPSALADIRDAVEAAQRIADEPQGADDPAGVDDRLADPETVDRVLRVVLLCVALLWAFDAALVALGPKAVEREAFNKTIWALIGVIAAAIVREIRGQPRE